LNTDPSPDNAACGLGRAVASDGRILDLESAAIDEDAAAAVAVDGNVVQSQSGTALGDDALLLAVSNDDVPRVQG